MKKQLSPAAIAGSIGGLVVLLAAVAFMVFRDPKPEKHPSMDPRDKIPAAPVAGEPPEWFKEKIRQNSNK